MKMLLDELKEQRLEFTTRLDARALIEYIVTCLRLSLWLGASRSEILVPDVPQ